MMQGATETESPDARLGEEPQTRVGAKIEGVSCTETWTSFIINVYGDLAEPSPSEPSPEPSPSRFHEPSSWGRQQLLY